MAIYVVGDVHGQYDMLCRLLEKCQFCPSQDQLWLTGDIVNRGPDSLEVCRFVRSLNDRAVVVLGNHDIHLLMVAAGVSPIRRQDTFQSILKASDGDDIIHWLRQCPLMHQEGEYAMVHAGLLPQWTVAKARGFAQEVEERLQQKKQYHKFLAGLYGDKPTRWSEDLKGDARYRTIVNVFCRLRFCTPKGEMDFQHKGKPNQAPAGFVPWFDVPNRKNADHVVITGHWSALGLWLTDNHLALDTGSCWGNALTAIRLEDRQIFQVMPLKKS